MDRTERTTGPSKTLHGRFILVIRLFTYVVPGSRFSGWELLAYGIGILFVTGLTITGRFLKNCNKLLCAVNKIRLLVGRCRIGIKATPTLNSQVAPVDIIFKEIGVFEKLWVALNVGKIIHNVPDSV